MQWLVAELGASEVVACAPMLGGSTSAMHRVSLRGRSEATTSVVLRRYVLDHYLRDEPEAPSAEASALLVAANASTPTPGLLASDVTATHCDAPTIVMRDLRGRPVWDMDIRGLERLVDALETVHSLDAAGLEVRDVARYRQTSFEPPRWVRDRNVWEQAVDIFHGDVPDDALVFAHRDFHPGNVLWQRRQITGIVDWQAACRAPASIDLAHCRLNFAFYDEDLPRLLRTTWERRTGRTFDPWADVMSIIGFLDSLRDAPPASGARHTIDDILTAAVADLRC